MSSWWWSESDRQDSRLTYHVIMTARIWYGFPGNLDILGSYTRRTPLGIHGQGG